MNTTARYAPVTTAWRARAGEPVDHRAAHEQAEDDLRLHEAQMGDGVAENIFQQHDDAENHRGRADDGGADEHGFGRGLEGVARAVAFFQFELGIGEIGLEAEFLFDFRADVGLRFDAAQFINRLGVVGHGAKTVHGNGDRGHGEETERDEAEREDGRGESELRGHERQQRGILREEIGNEHERPGSPGPSRTRRNFPRRGRTGCSATRRRGRRHW